MKQDVVNKDCFFCPKKINGQAVIWDETNNFFENPTQAGKIKLHLHPKCAISLAVRLIGDAYDADVDVLPAEDLKVWLSARVQSKQLIAKVGDTYKGKKLTKKSLPKLLNSLTKDEAPYGAMIQNDCLYVIRKYL